MKREPRGEVESSATRGGGSGVHGALARTVLTPIVDARGHIVGWTGDGPDIRGAGLHHAEAERLLGDDIMAIYVRIEDPLDARRAGAPPDWSGPWRCLALCSARLQSPAREGGIVPVVRSAPRAVSG